MLDRFAARLLVSAALLGAPGAAWALEQAGVSAAVRGSVALTREQVVGQQLASGEPLYLEDLIRSGPLSGMQILLLDQTSFTLGAESELVIDEFVYDPQSGSGKVGAQVVKGAFRFVTGRIAEAQPKDMTVKLPAGTVGIRGTIAAGLADPVTKGSTVVLLGAGRETDPTEKIGAIRVCNVGKCVRIRRPYFATRIPSGDQPPIRPFRISAEELEALINQLYAGAEPPTQVAGLPPVGAGGDDEGGGGPRPTLPSIPDPGAKERENPNVVDPGQPPELEPPGMPPLLTLATIDQLVGISSQQSGLAFYSRSGIPLTDGGSYDFRAMLDFGKLIVEAEAFNIRSAALGLSGASGEFPLLPFDDSLIAPETQYSFRTELLNDSEDLIEARLLVAFFNQAGASTANPPAFADSFLELENLDDSAAPLVTTAAGDDPSPLGGPLASHLFDVPSVSQLASITSGLATYERYDIPLTDGGSYDFVASLDFGQQVVNALAFDIESPDLLLSGQSIGGIAQIGSSSTPGGFYGFFDTVFSDEFGAVEAFLQVDFFSSPNLPAGAPPDFAGSFLELTDSGNRVATADDPLLPRRAGGALVPLLDDTLLSIATLSELAGMTSGSASYERFGIPLTDGGSYGVDVTVDFGQQTIDAFVFNLDAPSLELFGAGFGEVQNLSDSVLAPGAAYGFSADLFNQNEDQIAAELSVGLFNAPGHLAGTPPDLADSFLRLENLDDPSAAIVQTVPDQSPLGGALVPPDIGGEG
jgi:hypothetical protein